MTQGLPRYQLVALDCPDPLALANFYSQLTGLAVEALGDFAPDDVEWIELDNGTQPSIAFQKVPHHVAPTWPDGPVPQQLHIDFLVDDLEAGEQHVLAIGGSKHDVQPGTTFRVYLDPVGHLFCLVLDSD